MQKPRYADPSVIAVNKEDGHAIAMPYDAVEQALAGENSPYKQSLNGMWKFSWCRGVKNELAGFEAPAYDDSTWREIPVPSVWQTQGYSVPYYYASTYPRAISRSKRKIPKIDPTMQEVGYYRRTFTIDPGWKGRQVFLHFGAAKAALEVYVNGQFVGYSQGSMTPHEFDVTRYLLNGENLVCAKVYRDSDGRICGGCAAFTERCICSPSQRPVCGIFIFVPSRTRIFGTGRCAWTAICTCMLLQKKI